MSVAVPFYTASLALLLAFAILRFLFCTLVFRKLVVQLFIKFAGADMRKEVYGDSLFGWEMYKAVTTTLMIDLQKKVKRGVEAPNPLSLLHRRTVAIASFGLCQGAQAARGEFWKLHVPCLHGEIARI